MYELYIAIGILLIICGLISTLYIIFILFKTSNSELNYNFSEIFGVIVIGLFYIYCGLNTSEILNSNLPVDLKPNITNQIQFANNTADISENEDLQEIRMFINNLLINDTNKNVKLGKTVKLNSYDLSVNLEYSTKQCDFHQFWMEYATFISSFIHTITVLCTQILYQLKSKKKGSSNTEEHFSVKLWWKIFLTSCQWFIPILWISILYVCNIPQGSHSNTIIESHDIPINNSTFSNKIDQTITTIYKIIQGSQNTSNDISTFNITDFINNRIYGSRNLKECIDSRNMKLYMFGMLIFGYFLPILGSSIGYLNLKNKQLSLKSSLISAPIFWSPAFFDMCFHTMIGESKKSSVSNFLRIFANLYYIIRTRYLFKEFNYNYKSNMQIQPLST